MGRHHRCIGSRVREEERTGLEGVLVTHSESSLVRILFGSSLDNISLRCGFRRFVDCRSWTIDLDCLQARGFRLTVRHNMPLEERLPAS